MAVVTTNLGVVTAYGDAVEGGYTGTKEQWQSLMADYGTIGAQAQADAQTASTAATTATTAAQTATTKASEASASATQAQQAAASVSTPDTTLTQSGKAADAKATGDEISSLKEDLNTEITLTNGGKEWVAGSWAVGTIRRTNGEYISTSYKYRICTPDFVTFAKNTNYIIADGFILQVYVFDAEGTLTANPIDYTSAYNAPADTKLKFVIMRSVEDTSEIADVALFRSQVTTTSAIQNQIDEAVSSDELEDSITYMMAPIAKLSINEYDESKLMLGKRYRYDFGIQTDANFNVFPLKLPSGKKAVVTCRYNQASTRQYVRSCRFLTVLDLEGNYVYSSNSDTGSSVYTNNTDSDVIAYFTCYALPTNATDYMIQIVDSSTPTSQYVQDYVPFGFQFLTTDGQAYLENADFVVSPRVQSYFSAEVTDTVNKVLALIKKPAYTFAFVTDTHLLPDNLNSIRQTRDTFSNVKAVCDRVPVLKVFHGGDLVRSGWSHSTQDEVNVYINQMRMMMINSEQKVYAVNGNHDGINGAPPLETLYDCLMSHNEEYVDRIDDNPFYYADDIKNKIRSIFLSDPYLGTYGIPNAQLNWLKQTLDSVPNGYNVFVISHIDPSCSDFTTNKEAFCALLNSWHNHTGDYTSNTGKIIAMVVGHRHFDWTVPTSQSGLDFPVVVCTCSYSGYITPSATEVAYGAIAVTTRTDKTVLQDSWSVFVYRPDEEKLYLVRFGAGSDRTIDLANWDTTA